MQSNTLFSMLTAGALVWATVAAAQETPPVPPVETQATAESATIVRPSQDLVERLQQSKSRDGLIQYLERMAKQRAVNAAMLEEFEKRSEETARDGAIGNLLGATVLADLAEGIGPAIVLTEDYRHQLVSEAERTASLLVKRVKDIRLKDEQIRQLAEKIVRGQDTKGNPLSAVQLQALEKLMYDWKKHRSQMNLHREQYQSDLAFCKNELVEIEALDQFFDGESRVLESRVQQYLDAIEHGEQTIAAKEFKESRDVLINAVSVLKDALPKLPDPSKPHPGQVPTGPSIGSHVRSLGDVLTKEEKQFIEPELEAARQRLKGAPPEPQK